jgi:hypothetical protein
MKEETGVASRSQRPRIDIGRSLSIGKPSSKATDAPQPLQQNEVGKPPRGESADAAKVSLSKIFDGVAIPTSSQTTASSPQPIAKGREAAKYQYLQQSQASEPESTPASTSEISEAPSEPDVSAVLLEIESRLGKYDISDEEEGPKGDSVETLEPYAKKYVAFLEETGQSYSTAEREAKVKEITEFYSAPTRQGRLQSLVQDI